LLVISTGDSEGISLEFGAENFSIDIGTHSSIVEVTAIRINSLIIKLFLYLLDLIVIDFVDFLLSGGWVGNVILKTEKNS
jgi:hypothetical protein